MQAVILAAGRGTRMEELTGNIPKPLLEVAGKSLLAHKLDVLPEEITDVIIVVGYLGDLIRHTIGSRYGERNIRYVTQENPTGGTMDALIQAKPLLRGRFLVMNGDNIYAPEDMKSVMEYEWATVIVGDDGSEHGARVTLKDDRTIDTIVEAGYHNGEGYINVNLFSLDMRIFDFPPAPKALGENELGLPQTIIMASQLSGIPFHAVFGTFWIQIKDPADLTRAEKILKERKK